MRKNVISIDIYTKKNLKETFVSEVSLRFFILKNYDINIKKY